MISLIQAVSAARLFLRHPDYIFRVLYERIKPVLSYRFSREGRSLYPTTLIFFLTRECNMRCRMCGQRRHANTARAPEDMTARDFAGVVDEVAFCRPTITLFGGEPLLFEGWDEVAQHVKDRTMRCRMVTNGLLLEKNAARIVDIGLDKVNVSIDGPAPIHDQIRGVKGAFHRALRGIEAIDASKRKRRAQLPLVSVVCTISRSNHAHLTELAEALRDAPINSLVFQHLTFLDRAACEEHDRLFKQVFQQASPSCQGFVTEQGNLDAKVLAEQLERLAGWRAHFPILIRPDFPLDEVVDYYTRPEYQRRSHRACVAPWREAYVMPDGSLTPCLDFVVGNLRRQRFQDLWNCAAYRRFRATIKKRGRFPFCQRCCN